MERRLAKAIGTSQSALARLETGNLLGTLHPNPDDGLADFVVLREPTAFEGPRD